MLNRNARSIRRQQGGFSLIEMLVVLGLIVVMLVTFGPRMYRAYVKNDLVTESTNVRDLVTNLRAFRDYGPTGTDLVPLLEETKALPAAWRLVSGVPYSVWKTPVTITSTGLGVAIAYQDVPGADCIEFAASTSAGDLSTKVNSTAAVNGKMSAVQSQSACNDGGNTVTFTTLR